MFSVTGGVLSKPLSLPLRKWSKKRFFDHFLKGNDNGFDKTPPVTLNIRHPGEMFVLRYEHEWPLARTQWTKFHLDPAGMRLDTEPSAKAAKIDRKSVV